MSQLRTLLPLPAVPSTEGGSPDPGRSLVGDSADVVGASSRPSIRVSVIRGGGGGGGFDLPGVGRGSTGRSGN